ncbi:unnamed protein product [Cuscuta campestris]|uniref:Retrotransposon Copia-like N-terminal domain-containing protein n=1 Tax=Cuscuta campestris TaxID=132261 RepID=A0A484MU65_9ASTE|nr:unnamed protein product [Cuscuta campestris]
MAAPSDPLASLPSGVKLLLRSLHNLIPEKLTETNYPAWSLDVQTALSANLLLDGLMVMKQPRRQLSPKTIKSSLIQSIPPGPSLTHRSAPAS